MSDKELGTEVTYLDPEDKALDSVVYREGRPHSHAEANLVQDVQSMARAKALRALMPSGFLAGDFEGDSLTDFVFGTDANQFEWNGRIRANVNGWIVPISYTETATLDENVISLDVPPINPGQIAVDFVYLEVWLALVSPDPSTDNKPAADKIYRVGNVLSPMATWLDDDLQDTPVAIATGSETTRRVQVQYAIRKTRLASTTDRIGYTDANILAQGPNVAPVVGATFSASSADTGLWVAGDTIGSGNEIANTVDGFVYSIPICMVFRRNSSAFDYLANGNGGITGVGTITPSDRPDGYYSDQIVEFDVQDMRASVSAGKVDWSRTLEKNFSLLLDNELRSWVGQSSFTDFYVGGNNESFGSQYLKADDLLPSGSPDKPSGNTFRAPDGICSVFTDRPHLERFVQEYDAATFGTGGVWVSGNTITLDLVSTNIEDEQPVNTVISDVLSVRLNDAVAPSTGLPDFPVQNITGLGTGVVTITLDTPPVVSSEDIWVEFEMSYPSASGLTSLVKQEASNFSIVVHNPSAFNPLFSATFTDDPAGRAALAPFLTVDYEEGPHREVFLKYRPDTTRTVSTVSVGTDTLFIPEAAYVADPLNPNPDFTVTVDGNPKTITAISEDRRTLTFDPAEAAGGLSSSVEFTPHRPFPRNTVESTLYYLAPAIQALPFEFLDNPSDPVNLSLELEPMFVSDKVYSGTASSGSVITPYPYEAPLNQIPVSVNAGAAYQTEGELNAPGPISIDDFDADVGLLSLPAFVPLAFTDSITIQTPVNVNGAQTLEYIDHYTAIPDGDYIPGAIGQPLSDPVEHKVFIPFVAKLKRDTDFGREGTAVLVILSQYYDYSASLPSGTTVEQNKVVLDGDFSCAAIYRLKNHPISK